MERIGNGLGTKMVTLGSSDHSPWQKCGRFDHWHEKSAVVLTIKCGSLDHCENAETPINQGKPAVFRELKPRREYIRRIFQDYPFRIISLRLGRRGFLRNSLRIARVRALSPDRFFPRVIETTWIKAAKLSQKLKPKSPWPNRRRRVSRRLSLWRRSRVCLAGLAWEWPPAPRRCSP
jgi:hypothetical protein